MQCKFANNLFYFTDQLIDSKIRSLRKEIILKIECLNDSQN